MVFRYEREEGKTGINNLLLLTSSLYSINLMSSEAVNKPAGTQIIYFRKRVITVFKTVVGMTFIFVADAPVDLLFQKIYEHYVDYVTKNPFHHAEMPLNSSKFRPQHLFGE